MDITKIVMALLSLIFAFITYFVIPLIRSKTSSETFAQIQFWTTIAVEAAEQIYNQPGMGQEKKAYVIEFLNSRGYKLDEDALDKLIEAAVLELKNSIAN